jgi:hypothetical protein
MSNPDVETELVVERTVREYPNLPSAGQGNPQELSLRQILGELFRFYWDSIPPR